MSHMAFSWSFRGSKVCNIKFCNAPFLQVCQSSSFVISFTLDTWRSGVRTAMRVASQLPGRGPTVVDIDLVVHVIKNPMMMMMIMMMMRNQMNALF